MALGTITVNAKSGFKPMSPDPVLDISFAGDGDYHTDGTPDFQALVRAKADDQALEVMGIVELDGTAGHYLVYDKANDKLKAFVRTTGLEVANHGDLHLTTFRYAVYCR